MSERQPIETVPMRGFEYLGPVAHGHAPIKTWNRGVDFDAKAISQLRNIASLPFIHSHVAAMPDAHVGIGATVGSVIATRGAIIPSAVGVDIGCGMCAWQLTLTANDLPDNLGAVRSAIEAAVPHGRTDNGGKNDRGTWHDVPDWASEIWLGLADRYAAILDKHPKAATRKQAQYLGTLGTGNHFIELCLDQDDRVWVMLHSGSRGLGNRIGQYFIEKAKEEIRKYFISLQDMDCAYLVEKSELFDDYIDAVSWAQDFALRNRLAIMEQILRAIRPLLTPYAVTETAVNCHHNYVARENHGEKNVLVTRKGALRAREGDLGIIPGSMGTGSFIVRGRGNPDSFCSCSHGAGRRMSRADAKKNITLADHVAATAHVECRKDVDVIDESPAAYKDIGAVIAAQIDLIDVLHRLRGIVNVKG